MEDLGTVFERAAGNVVAIWPNVIERDDLVQELWVWAAERPSVSKILSEKPAGEVYKFVSRHAHQIAAEQFEHNVRFGAKYEYAVDVAKGILKGKITGVQAVNDLAQAIENLADNNERYADLIRRRYFQQESLTGAEKKALSLALTQLTDEMNRIARLRSENLVAEPGKTLGDGPGAPKLIPISINEEIAEARPAQQYYNLRKPKPRVPRERRFPEKSLAELQKSDPFYPYAHRY